MNRDSGARPLDRRGVIELFELSVMTGIGHVATAEFWPRSAFTFTADGHVLNSGGVLSENTLLYWKYDV